MLEAMTRDRIRNGRLPERTNGAASKAVVASGSPWVRIPHLPPFLQNIKSPFHDEVALQNVLLRQLFGEAVELFLPDLSQLCIDV